MKDGDLVGKVEKNKNIERVKNVLRYGFKIIMGALILISVFFLGRFTEKNDHPVEEIVIMRSFNADDITIAVDQNDNLIVIDNETKYYNVYEDSIGYSVFKLYYKAILDKQ